MSSIIEKLYYGNYKNSNAIECDCEYQKIRTENINLSKTFIDGLTEKQKKDYEKLCDLDVLCEALSVKQHYIDGFKLGFLIASECLKE